MELFRICFNYMALNTGRECHRNVINFDGVMNAFFSSALYFSGFQGA